MELKLVRKILALRFVPYPLRAFVQKEHPGDGSQETPDRASSFPRWAYRNHHRAQHAVRAFRSTSVRCSFARRFVLRRLAGMCTFAEPLADRADAHLRSRPNQACSLVVNGLTNSTRFRRVLLGLQHRRDSICDSGCFRLLLGARPGHRVDATDADRAGGDGGAIRRETHPSQSSSGHVDQTDVGDWFHGLVKDVDAIPG